MRYPDGKKIRLYSAVGKKLHDVRVAAGISRPDLAKCTGVSVQQLAKIEDGYPCPLHVLVALADAYDTTLDALVPVLTDTRAA